MTAVAGSTVDLPQMGFMGVDVTLGLGTHGIQITVTADTALIDPFFAVIHRDFFGSAVTVSTADLPGLVQFRQRGFSFSGPECTGGQQQGCQPQQHNDPSKHLFHDFLLSLQVCADTCGGLTEIRSDRLMLSDKRLSLIERLSTEEPFLEDHARDQIRHHG